MTTSLTQGVALVRAAFSDDGSGTENLRTILRSWTRLEERENVEADLVISMNVPGYLETDDQQGVKVYVPLNLVRVSPTRRQRESIHKKATSFRIQSKHDYCISGSATFLGVTTAIDDIDLAEYLAIEFPAVVGKITEMASQPSREDIAFLHLTVHFWEKAGKRKAEADFPHILQCVEAIDPRAWIKLRIDGTAHFEIDYLGKKDLSNTAFPALPGHYSLESSVYQEIVLVDHDCTAAPRSLADHAQITGYLDFLELNAREWKDEFTITSEAQPALKSLKRTLSLLLMLGSRHRFQEGLSLIPPDLSPGQKIEGFKIAEFVDSSLAFYVECRNRSGASKRYERIHDE